MGARDKGAKEDVWKLTKKKRETLKDVYVTRRRFMNSLEIR